jgi:hypothetical protein
MRTVLTLALLAVFAFALTAAWAAGSAVAPTPNGVAYPAGWENWRVVAISHRTDNNSLRAILGNDVAVRAARAGQVNPWPDGSVLAKVMWKDATHERCPAATVPGDFAQVEFMLKDSNTRQPAAGASRGGAVGISRPTGKMRTLSRSALAATRP